MRCSWQKLTKLTRLGTDANRRTSSGKRLKIRRHVTSHVTWSMIEIKCWTNARKAPWMQKWPYTDDCATIFTIHLLPQVLKYCPKDLQADICVHMNRTVLDNNPAFMEANTGVKRALARNFWICHVAPGDRIIHHGESLDVLYFIAHGSLEVKQGDSVVGLLGKDL